VYVCDTVVDVRYVLWAEGGGGGGGGGWLGDYAPSMPDAIEIHMHKWIQGARLQKYRACFRMYRALLWMYRALLWMCRALLWMCRALLWMYLTLLWMCRALCVWGSFVDA